MTQQNNQQIAIREETGRFIGVLNSPAYQDKFKAMLPSDVDVSRFTNVVITAIQENPDLMKPSTDKSSLLLACQKAAKDGLVPDGKQAALVMYGTKVQYQPMIAGFRRQLARIGIDLRTVTVKENDEFDYELGDEPRITHKPAKFGLDRGKTIGFYAIATDRDGRKYRDVMSKAEVDYVRSKAKTGAVWNSWYDPMGEKTVGRRLVKQLPIAESDERLREMLRNDDENFDLGPAEPPKRSSVAEQVQSAARGSVIDGEFAQVPADDGQDDAGDGAPPDHDDPGF